MQEPSTSYFFDLSNYDHAELFQGLPSGSPWEVLLNIGGYLQTCRLGQVEGAVSNKAHLIDPHLIYIGPGSVVEPGAYIKGPCVLGRNCTVRHGAYIRGNVLVGDNAVIGHATEVKSSVLLDGVKAPHFAFVGDSIVGNHVNLGAGARLANFRFDGRPITINYGHQRIQTALRKLGALVGDGCSLGCNCVTHPGALLGKTVFTYPCIAVRGFIPSGSIIKSSQEILHETIH